MTFASAFSRVHQTAISRGWISDRVPIPTMSRRGAKGEVRPAFSVEEITQLRQFMISWQTHGHRQSVGGAGWLPPSIPSQR